jgi:hypothetical protein
MEVANDRRATTHGQTVRESLALSKKKSPKRSAQRVKLAS